MSNGFLIRIRLARTLRERSCAWVVQSDMSIARAVVLSSVLVCSVAAADQMVPTLGQPLSEVSHTVDISVQDGVATYRVQRVFANEGKVADEASLDIDMPFGGAITGLRIHARDTWYDGDLMEATQAAKLYQELTGRGAFPVKDPALLQWVWADKVHLQVFPVLPGRTSTVEYTITLPTRYEHGRWLLSYPRFNGGPLAKPVITVRPVPGVAAADQRVDFDGERVAVGEPVTLASPKAPETWDGVVPRDPDAGWVVSRLEVRDGHGAMVRHVGLDLDITHTYKGDLLVQLVTPSAQVINVHDRSGGGGNDVRGHFELDLPADTAVAGTWRLVVSDHAARDVGTINAWRLSMGPVVAAASDLPIFIPDAPEGADDLGLVTIDVAAPPVDTMGTRLGRVVASAQHAFLRLELDLAAELRPAPKRANVVFVVDGSRSMGDAGIDAQLAIARAYLGHVPDATFQLVIYRRFATALGFAPAARFDAVVAKAKKAGKLEPGNGSALDAGVAMAAHVLHGKSGPCRIVVLTDELLRTGFSNSLVLPELAVAPAGTVVHVVATDGGEAGGEAEARQDDDDPLAAIAAGGKGILVHLDNPRGKGLSEVVLHLVRPTRIDHFHVGGVDVERAALVPETLPEGTGVRAMLPLASAPQSLTLDGKIWGEPFHREISVSPSFSVATAGFVFSEHQYVDLDEQEQMAVALFGHAVSPVTSFIAVEPGVRPSTVGLARTEEVRGSRGVGSGYGGGYGSGRGAARHPPDLQGRLRAGADRCIARHRPAAGWSFAVGVETTRDEIVDVVAGDRAASVKLAPVETCIVEAAWAMRLDNEFDLEREHFALAFAH